MTDATAQYILKARDDSRGALATFKRGFDDIDKSVRVATRSLNLMTEIFIGAKAISAIRRFTDHVLQASAAADDNFGKALRGVKGNFDALLVPKKGLAGATDAMNDLAGTLKDPQLVRAADALTSSLIHGFTNFAKLTAGVVGDINEIFNPKESESIRRKIIGLESERTRLSDDHSMGSRFNPTDGKRQAAIDEQLIALSAKYIDVSKREQQADIDAMKAAKALEDAKQAINDTKARSIRLSYELKKAMDQVDAGGKFLETFETFDQANKDAEKLTRTSVENQIQQWDDFYKALDRLRSEDLINQAEYDKRSREFIDSALQEIQVTSDFAKTEQKKSFDEMTDFARQAASSTQQVFADFFFDPFHAGLKGMVIDFANIIRRLVAEAAAADLMKALFGTDKSGQAGMSFFAGILGAIFGGGGGKAAAGTGNFIGPRAGGGPVMAGGAYLVGENGPEMFFPGSSGNIAANGSLGGDQISIVINAPVDARGAQEGQALQLARVMRANNESLKQDIFEGLRRRKYRV